TRRAAHRGPRPWVPGRAARQCAPAQSRAGSAGRALSGSGRDPLPQTGATERSRPSPDALLEAARAEERGRLKVFLGAAPGVGKTYAMLRAAHRRKAEGLDVVVGLVETHGRRETEELLSGLEVLPRLTLAYRGQTLTEFNLDTALARKPKLILVD